MLCTQQKDDNSNLLGFVLQLKDQLAYNELHHLHFSFCSQSEP
jgi:hypothetical protein